MNEQVTPIITGPRNGEQAKLGEDRPRLLLLRRYHAGLLDGDLASGERIHDRHMSARFEILEGGQAAVTRLQRREPIEVH